jgi:hypothetical protein
VQNCFDISVEMLAEVHGGIEIRQRALHRRREVHFDAVCIQLLQLAPMSIRHANPVDVEVQT